MSKPFTSSSLKIIGIITMFIDHIGATYSYRLVGIDDTIYFPLRILGRLAFPIFAFLISEGYYFTRNKNKYLIRLLIFAFVSEIPFDLAFYGEVLDFSHQNVFFTLGLGLYGLMIFEKYKDKDFNTAFIFVIFIGLLSIIIRTDYNIFGVLMIFFFYYYRKSLLKSGLSLIIINLSMVLIQLSDGIHFEDFLQLFSIFDLLLIFLYNRKKGRNLKYIFYLFYPVHLLFLFFINYY